MHEICKNRKRKKNNKIQKSSVGFMVTSHTGLMSLLVL